MSRILVIGASGFIGKATLENLTKTAAGEIHAVYNSREPKCDNKIVRHKVDLFKHKEIEDLFSAVAPTHLIQLAWCSDHATYWKDVANLDWVSVNFAIARSFVRNGGRRCLFIGTSAEYDWSVQQPLNEVTTPLVPQMLYGSAKLGLYWSLSRFFEQARIPMLWARLFNPFGHQEDVRRLIPKTCLRLLRGESIQFDAALSLRDFLHVDDVGAAISRLLLSTVEGPVNIGSGQAISIRDVVSQIAAYYGYTDRVTFATHDASDVRPDIVVADVTRLAEEASFRPQKDFTVRLQETCNWWAEHTITKKTE